eukprot:GFKZ01011679.1.p1 GENE.GFKZ01011679.1~~GFKZ01011679.1.p1  ORF type:complete len:307 (+),score=41.25 GFKZ01011679.1:244-1164(+)
MPFPALKLTRRLDTRSPYFLLLPFLFPTLLLFIPLPSLRSLDTDTTAHTAAPLPELHTPHHHPIPQNYTPPTHCVLYDRPPHTGSTTISTALHKCLVSHHYATTTFPWDAVPPENTISDLIYNHSNPHRAAIDNHLSISPTDVYLLHLLCSPNLLYITSTRNMRARITSSAKYNLTPTHHSSNLTADQLQQAMAIALGDRVNEHRLERYPFDDPRVTLTPDFIVRYEHLEADLANLLTAMKCDSAFDTLNVHRMAEGGEEAEAVQERTRQALRLRFGDQRHRRMVRLAEEGNQKGLDKTREWFGQV